VAQLASQGISVAAITDYNHVSPVWFPELRDKARQRGIVLLPGAELCFRYGRGLHVLAVFGSDSRAEDLNQYIWGLDVNPRNLYGEENRQHEAIVPRLEISEILRNLRDVKGAVIVFPHPGEQNGLFKSLSAEGALDILLASEADALEHCCPKDLHRLRSTGKLPEDLWERISLVEFSDAKSIDDIGTKRAGDRPRATYLKLSALDVDALRLVLHDPGTRCSIGWVPAVTHSRILRMKVTGAAFLGDFSVDWNDYLNAMIGGRGAGKSAILETLRYCLGMSPYSEQAYRESLIKHALGSGGKVEVLLERPVSSGQSRRYIVSRVFGEDPRVFDAQTKEQLSLPPSGLLGPFGSPVVLGQREMYAVSTSEQYRLTLLDELVGDEVREKAQAVASVVAKLRENARLISAERAKLVRREEYVQRLQAVQHELDVYEKHGAAEKLREASCLRSDERRLSGANQKLKDLQESWLRFVRETSDLLDAADRDLQRAESSQKAILEKAKNLLTVLREALVANLGQGQARIEEAANGFKGLTAEWRDALQPMEEDLNRIKRESRSDALDPERLLRLAEQRSGLTPLIEELDRSVNRLRDLDSERRALLTRMRDLRHVEHDVRRSKAQAITAHLDGQVRLDVGFKGQKADYEAALTAILKGSGVTGPAIERLVAPEANDGLSLAEAMESGSEEVQRKYQLTAGMADRLIRWFSEDEPRLFELQVVTPPDSVSIELHVDGQYRGLDRLSAGQRATAVLLLLLALPSRILVLDQPEDDLDSRFIYDDIVKVLRRQKNLRGGGGRQIILATHNPNIPVIGDAELVLALEGSAGRMRVTGAASIDASSIRQQVKLLMEGGEQAFLRRAEKYGGIR